MSRGNKTLKQACRPRRQCCVRHTDMHAVGLAFLATSLFFCVYYIIICWVFMFMLPQEPPYHCTPYHCSYGQLWCTKNFLHCFGGGQGAKSAQNDTANSKQKSYLEKKYNRCELNTRLYEKYGLICMFGVMKHDSALGKWIQKVVL